MIKSIKCDDCGNIFSGYHNRKLCDGCQIIHGKLSDKDWNNKRDVLNRTKKGLRIKIPKGLTDLEKLNWYLENRTERDGECLIWTGSVGYQGYGRASFSTNTVKSTVLAHRFFYYLMVGQTPEPLHHSCANTLCVNVEHLVPASQAENTLEMLARRGYECRILELENKIYEYENNLEIGLVMC